MQEEDKVFLEFNLIHQQTFGLETNA